jgi:hypothetical protein
MLSQNIVPSPRTRATVGHHRKATSLPQRTHTTNKPFTGEERTLIRCSLCRLAATGPVAIAVADMEITTVAAPVEVAEFSGFSGKSLGFSMSTELVFETGGWELETVGPEDMIPVF